MTFLRLSLILPLMAVAACDQLGLPSANTPAPKPVVSTATTSDGTTIVAAPTADGDAVVIATPPPSGNLPQPAALSVAQLDTTTATEKARAASTAGGAGQRLGTTIASLGDATQAGFWIKTPLARAPGKGRIVNPATGKSANVDLIPLDGPPTAGSQVSLPALQMIGASLTDLPEIEVWGA